MYKQPSHSSGIPSSGSHAIIRRLPQHITEAVRSHSQVPDLPAAACELVLNSLEAGARHIRVTASLEAWSLSVEDDGCGIAAASMPLLGQRSCTSKPSTGRGEALASLAQVCQQVTVTSRAAGAFETHRKQLVAGASDACTSTCINTTSAHYGNTAAGPLPAAGHLSTGIGLSTNTSTLCAVPRQHQGTTVALVGFLHNQPVRRRSLQQQQCTGAAAAAVGAASIGHAAAMQALKLALFTLVLPHTGVELVLQQAGSSCAVLHMPQDRTLAACLEQLFSSQQQEQQAALHYVSTPCHDGWQLDGCVLEASFGSKQQQLLYVNRSHVCCPMLTQLLRDWFHRHVQSCLGTGGAPNPSAADHVLPGSTSRRAEPGYVLLVTCPPASCTITRQHGCMQLLAHFAGSGSAAGGDSATGSTSSSSLGRLSQLLQAGIGPAWGSLPSSWKAAVKDSRPQHGSAQPEASSRPAGGSGGGSGQGGQGGQGSRSGGGIGSGCGQRLHGWGGMLGVPLAGRSGLSLAPGLVAHAQLAQAGQAGHMVHHEQQRQQQHACGQLLPVNGLHMSSRTRSLAGMQVQAPADDLTAPPASCTPASERPVPGAARQHEQRQDHHHQQQQQRASGLGDMGPALPHSGPLQLWTTGTGDDDGDDDDLAAALTAAEGWAGGSGCGEQYQRCHRYPSSPQVQGGPGAAAGAADIDALLLQHMYSPLQTATGLLPVAQVAAGAWRLSAGRRGSGASRSSGALGSNSSRRAAGNLSPLPSSPAAGWDADQGCSDVTSDAAAQVLLGPGGASCSWRHHDGGVAGGAGLPADADSPLLLLLLLPGAAAAATAEGQGTTTTAAGAGRAGGLQQRRQQYNELWALLQQQEEELQPDWQLPLLEDDGTRALGTARAGGFRPPHQQPEKQHRAGDQQRACDGDDGALMVSPRLRLFVPTAQQHWERQALRQQQQQQQTFQEPQLDEVDAMWAAEWSYGRSAAAATMHCWQHPIQEDGDEDAEFWTKAAAAGAPVNLQQQQPDDSRGGAADLFGFDGLQRSQHHQHQQPQHRPGDWEGGDRPSQHRHQHQRLPSCDQALHHNRHRRQRQQCCSPSESPQRGDAHGHTGGDEWDDAAQPGVPAAASPACAAPPAVTGARRAAAAPLSAGTPGTAPSPGAFSNQQHGAASGLQGAAALQQLLDSPVPHPVTAARESHSSLDGGVAGSCSDGGDGSSRGVPEAPAGGVAAAMMALPPPPCVDPAAGALSEDTVQQLEATPWAQAATSRHTPPPDAGAAATALPQHAAPPHHHHQQQLNTPPSGGHARKRSLSPASVLPLLPPFSERLLMSAPPAARAGRRFARSGCITTNSRTAARTGAGSAAVQAGHHCIAGAAGTSAAASRHGRLPGDAAASGAGIAAGSNGGASGGGGAAAATALHAGKASWRPSRGGAAAAARVGPASVSSKRRRHTSPAVLPAQQHTQPQEHQHAVSTEAGQVTQGTQQQQEQKQQQQQQQQEPLEADITKAAPKASRGRFVQLRLPFQPISANTAGAPAVEAAPKAAAVQVEGTPARSALKPAWKLQTAAPSATRTAASAAPSAAASAPCATPPASPGRPLAGSGPGSLLRAPGTCSAPPACMKAARAASAAKAAAAPQCAAPSPGQAAAPAAATTPAAPPVGQQPQQQPLTPHTRKKPGKRVRFSGVDECFGEPAARSRAAAAAAAAGGGSRASDASDRGALGDSGSVTRPPRKLPCQPELHLALTTASRADADGTAAAAHAAAGQHVAAHLGALRAMHSSGSAGAGAGGSQGLHTSRFFPAIAAPASTLAAAAAAASAGTTPHTTPGSMHAGPGPLRSGIPGGLGGRGGGDSLGGFLASSSSLSTSGPAILSVEELGGQPGCLLVPQGVSRQQLAAGNVIAQADSKLVLLRCGSVLLAVDQHAADERVQLEGLQRQAALEQRQQQQQLGQRQQQQLVQPGANRAPCLLQQRRLQPPLPISLSMREAAALSLHPQQVLAWGWQVTLCSEGGGSSSCAGHTAAALVPGGGGGGGGGGRGGAAGGLRPVEVVVGTAPRALLQQVPLLAGVQLGAVDLQLYLHQLLDTCGGSSQPPPGVLRLLRSKACRRAIMFGRALAHQECEALVRQLVATELCFMCAHGRPTTVPLLDLGQLAARLQQRRRAVCAALPAGAACGAGEGSGAAAASTVSDVRGQSRRLSARLRRLCGGAAATC